jgi:hypothetical protein
MDNSYKSAHWREFESAAESKWGIPSGFLADLRLKGEKSNADQVSEASAKSVWQIIPETRNLIKKKYGVDAYASPDQAAEAAAIVVKDAFNWAKQRSKDPQEQKALAAGYYHAGGNTDNWGERTNAYIKRVTGTVEKAATKVKDDLSGLVEIYQSGKMDPEDAAIVEQAIKSGQIKAPKAAAKAPAAAGTDALMQVYRSGKMDPADAAEFEQIMGIKKEQPGLMQQIGRQVGLTGRYAMEGVANAVGVVTNPITSVLEQATGKDLQTVPELATSAANSMGLPKPQGAVENVVGAASRGVAGAVPFIGAGTAMANATSPVTQSVGRALAAQPGGQLASNAAGAGSAEVVNQEGGGQLAQTAAALVGGVAGQALVNRASAVPQMARPAPRPQILQDAQAANIPMMTTDVVPPKTFMGKFAQGIGEKIPVAGTSSQRATQQSARVAAVRRIAADVGGDFENIPDSALSQSLRSGRAAEVQKYGDLKQSVFDKLDNAGAMPAANVTKHVDDEIQRLQALGTKDFDPLISKLDDFKQAIQGKTINQVELLRRQLGEKLESDEFTAIAGESQKVLRSTYGALKSDIESFIKTSASDRDVTKWKVADKRLSSMIGELESTAFKRALDKGELTPETAQKLLLKGEKSDLKRMYRTLTPEGRSVARATIIKDAVDKAGGLEDLSPQKFATALSKNSDQYGVFFTEVQRKQADGLIRVLNATQRASEAAAAPMTGYQAIPLALVDLFGSGGKTIAAGLTMGGFARAYESKPVRDMLVKLSSVKPQSVEEGAIVRRVIPMIQEMTQPKEEK